MRTILALVAVACLFGLAGCVSTEAKLDPIPLSDSEIEFLKKMEEADASSVKKDTPELFFHLNQMLKSWRDSSVVKSSDKHRRIYTSIGAMLTRWVYLNFDKILDELDNGPHPNRVTAATALGFSRIPENDRWPQVYQRAIPALLRALESGDDDITANALLGLKILDEPGIPLDPILPLMTQHHNPLVRSNAALCVATVAMEDQSDLIMPYLLPALRDDEPKVRIHAINIAMNLRSRSTVVPIMELLEDRYELIQANAARALGELGDPSVCGALISKVKHPKEIVRFSALESLQKLSGEDFGDDVADWTEWWQEYRANLRNR